MITFLQLLVLCWGLGLALFTVLVTDPANRDRATDFQLLALWSLFVLGWLK